METFTVETMKIDGYNIFIDYAIDDKPQDTLALGFHYIMEYLMRKKHITTYSYADLVVFYDIYADPMGPNDNEVCRKGSSSLVYFIENCMQEKDYCEMVEHFHRLRGEYGNIPIALLDSTY